MLPKNQNKMSDKKLDLLYDKTLHDFIKNKPGRVRRQVNNVLKLIDLSKDEKILEIGVATGKFTSIFTDCNKCYSLDILFSNLQRCQRAVSEIGRRENLFCIAADCSAMPFSDSSFNKIMAIDIIEHIEDDVFDMFCKQAYRVLIEKGSLYLYTPNLLHPYELARPFRPVLRKEHIGVRSMAKICSFLKKNNFLIKKKHFFNCFRRIGIEAIKAEGVSI